jgi:hypothetical protein
MLLKLQDTFIFVGHDVWWTKSLWDLLFGNFVVIQYRGNMVARRPSARNFAKNYIRSEMTIMESINTWWTQPSPVSRKHRNVLKGNLSLLFGPYLNVIVKLNVSISLPQAC